MCNPNLITTSQTPKLPVVYATIPRGSDQRHCSGCTCYPENEGKNKFKIMQEHKKYQVLSLLRAKMEHGEDPSKSICLWALGITISSRESHSKPSSGCNSFQFTSQRPRIVRKALDSTALDIYMQVVWDAYQKWDSSVSALMVRLRFTGFTF